MVAEQVVSKISVLRLVGAVFLLLSTPATDAAQITCSVPRVRVGESTNVTCDFVHNVSKLGTATVTVEHYPKDSDIPDTVLDCTPVGSQCKLKEGYEFDGKIGTTLVLKITRASTEHEGRFLCKMLSPDLKEKDEVEPCDFTLDKSAPPSRTEDDTTSSPTSQEKNDGMVIGIAVGVTLVFCAVIALLAGCCVAKKKKRLCFEPPREANEGVPLAQNVPANAITPPKTPEAQRLLDEPPVNHFEEPANVITPSKTSDNRPLLDESGANHEDVGQQDYPPETKLKEKVDEESSEDGEDVHLTTENPQKPVDESPADSPRDNASDGADSRKSDEAPAEGAMETRPSPEENGPGDHTDSCQEKESPQKGHVAKMKENFQGGKGT